MELGQKQQVRWVRSLLVAALTACSAGVAHAAGGGHRAPVLLLVALTAVGTPIMHAMSRRRWTFVQLVAVMGFAQVALHAAMTMMMPASMSMTHHVDAGALAGSPAPTDVSMAASHVAMTLLFAAALAYGEKVLAWTIRVLVPRLVTAPFGEFTALRAAFDVVRAPRAADRRAPRASRAPPSGLVLIP